VATHHRTVDRVVAILELAAARPTTGVDLRTLATALSAPRSSTHGLARGLVAAGYLEERDRRYHLGPGPQLLFTGPDRTPLAKLAMPELRRLHGLTGETALLGVRVGHAVVYTEQLESDHPLRYAAPLYSRRPVLTTSVGKAFLADLSDAEVRKLARDIAVEGDVVDVDALLDELSEVRERGYTLNRGVTIPGITALGAGIREPSGRVCAAISVNGPSERMEEHIPACARAVVESAARLTDALRAAARPS
jgi:DNA-binding IclR family transcriptional regulator